MTATIDRQGLLETLREALIQADLKIRSLPGTDQSDVEFIRVALSQNAQGGAASGYAAVEADVRKEWRNDRSVSPLRVVREMATWAGINGAEALKDLCNDVCADANREDHKFVQHRDALRSLLFALHARPFHGHPLLPLEEAIAAANEVLDKRAS